MTDADRVPIAMEALARLLANTLRESARHAGEAHALFAAGNRNGAVGTLALVDLDSVVAIKTALLVLHRQSEEERTDA